MAMKIDIKNLIPESCPLSSASAASILYIYRDQLNEVLQALDDTGVMWGNGDRPSQFDPPANYHYIALYFYVEERGKVMYYEDYTTDQFENLNTSFPGKVFLVDDVLVDDAPPPPRGNQTVESECCV